MRDASPTGWRGILQETFTPAIFTTIITAVSTALLIALSAVEWEMSDHAFMSTCILLTVGPAWWVISMWSCRDCLHADIYILSYTTAVVSSLPPVVSMVLEVFLYFFDDDTLAIQATLAITQVGSLFMQAYTFWVAGKLSTVRASQIPRGK